MKWRIVSGLLLAATGSVVAIKAAPPPVVWRHDDWIDGLNYHPADIRDATQVFADVFGQLPAEVPVRPTENYYYWQSTLGGRVLNGNIRFAVEARARGELAFTYAEPAEFLDAPERTDRLVVSATLSAADGVTVEPIDAFTVRVTHRAHRVTFHLNQLPQRLPEGFPLRDGERFLQRTEDESGLRFFLLYHERSRYFFWVLDDGGPVPEVFRPLASDVVIGRRTGFVFWRQPVGGGRLVLASVRRASLERNDYHDGPFDQLADNFVEGDGLRPFLEEAMPWVRGRVDAWGQLTDSPVPRRVALTAHGLHDRPADALALISEAKLLPDPVAHLAQAGRAQPPRVSEPSPAGGFPR